MKEININNFEEKLYYEKLDNGMEVFLVPMENKKNYYVSLSVKFGGAIKSFKVNNQKYNIPTGIAHFLEHKLFEKEDSPFNFYMKSGTDVNASTTTDYTSYYFMGNNDVYNNLKYLLNWVTNFSVTKQQVEKEKGIILEEASMYKDVPERILYEKISKSTYINHPYKEKVIGTDKDIKRITKEQLELCYNSFYRPDNMFLIATGAFNQDEFIKTIKEELKDYKNPNNTVKVLEKAEPDKVKKHYKKIKMNVEVPKIAISYKINKNKFKDLELDKYQLDYYLQMILSIAFGTTSTFIEKLLLDKTILSLVYELVDIESHYVIDVYVTSNNYKKFMKLFNQYIKNLNLEKEEFERTIKTWIASEVRLIDQVVSTARNILYDVIDYKEFKNDKIKDLRNLDSNTLEKVLERLDFTNQAVVKITSNS